MASNLTGEESAAAPPHRIFGRGRLLFSLALLALLILCLIFTWATRDALANRSFMKRQQKGPAAAQDTVVDLRPWQIAQALAAQAVTSEEIELARDAERLADHEVDQAFASALRQANARRPVLTGEALKLSQKLIQLQQLVKEDQARVQSLTQNGGRPAAAPANGASPTLGNDLDVAKAQLGLDSDELTDAQQDLARAVNDPRTRIQQELVAHEAAMRKYDAEAGEKSQVAVVSAGRYGSLANRLQAWSDQRSRYQSIQQAMQQAQTDAAALIAEHNELESQANAASSAGADDTAKIASLNQRAGQRQLLGIYDDRIQTQQQLAAVYDKWSAQVLLQHRIVLHLVLRSFTWIALILFCVVVLDAVVRHFVERPGLDRRRMQTLRTIFKLAIQAVGVLLILLVVFGAPSQMPAIIGLTTAGMTVALQDFILAFLGWFILMGKNGIRVGDWVEINGIGGEVVETGLFRTVMLETGNWTDKGHPTGRRITFMNSFAVKGQYFNFSTTGQWMWDEITLTVPPAADTYRIIELIHKAVLKETENDARQAEEEWKRVSRKQGLTQFTAATAVDMRPSGSGIDLIVRYITRASQRFEVRNRLYQLVIGLLHQPVDTPTLSGRE
ncbi:MAG TPA: mechanosensitive ion channel domain-containing protein [Bryobacteraceae bacterium]|jgi:small-conductance mechanosensitive channel